MKVTAAVRVLEWSLVALAVVLVWSAIAVVVWATIVSLVKRGGRR